MNSFLLFSIRIEVFRKHEILLVIFHIVHAILWISAGLKQDSYLRAVMTTVPLQYVKNNENKAFRGLHDFAVRYSIPGDLMSISMPYTMFTELCDIAFESFLGTEKWQKVRKRL